MTWISKIAVKQSKDGDLPHCPVCEGCRLCHCPLTSDTARGFIFISIEDETGIVNVIVTPDVYEGDRLVVARSKFIVAGRRPARQRLSAMVRAKGEGAEVRDLQICRCF
jgi:hypothetical protein